MNVQLIKALSASLLACLLAYPPGLAAQDAPSISLFTFNGETRISQSMADPLLIYVIIDNSVATLVERHNQRNQAMIDQYQQTEDFQGLSKIEKMEVFEQFPVRDIPTFSLGSDHASVQSLIVFLVRDEQDNTIDIPVRGLEANGHQPGAITLIEGQSLYYQFVIESDHLKQLSPGTYRLVASVDTTRESGMWNGWFYSHDIEMVLSGQHPDPGWETSDEHMSLQSTFLVNDHQFRKAEKQARAWINQHAKSIDAWIQLGEALHGQGKNDDALEAFNTAIMHFRDEFGDTPEELPQAILDRVREIEED